jgi:hypothetical protein
MTAILWLAFLLIGQGPLVGKGTIHGRVLQPNDQPAAGISVELVKALSDGNGPRRLESSGQPVAIGASGEYRFDVVPGEYYVRTVTTPGGPRARTYFPNTSNPAEAKAIVVTQGDDVSADIHLSTTPVFKISGRIVDLLPDRRNHYPVGASLSSNSATAREYKMENPFAGQPFCCDVERVPDPNVSVTLSNDRFEIRGVRPGTYRVTAAIVVKDAMPDGGIWQLKIGEEPPFVRYKGQVTVEVTNSDVEDIRVEVRHGADLNGRIVSKGNHVHTNETNIFMMGPDYDSESLLFTSVDKSGRFAFTNLLDGAYRLDPAGLAFDAYVEEIRQGGKKLPGPELTINRANPKSLEIIMNPAPGGIDGQIPGSSPAVVVLVPMDAAKKYFPPQVRGIDPPGDFTFRDLAPGRYRIFAFNNVERSDVFRTGSVADFVRPFEVQSTPLVVKAGARTSVKLNAIDVKGSLK